MAKKKNVKKEQPEAIAEAPAKKEVKEEVKSGEYTAIIDINPTYKKGMVVPKEQVDHWKNNNEFDIDLMVSRS